MIELMPAAVELDAPAAQAISAVLRDVARVDGNHPQELALIGAFEQGLGDTHGEPDLRALDTPELKAALVRSMVLLGLADNHISDAEHARILEWTRKLGLGEADLAREVMDVASAMLGQFKGVHLFRDQVMALGREMGLDEATIRAVID